MDTEEPAPKRDENAYRYVADVTMRYGYVFQPNMQKESAEMVAYLREKMPLGVSVGFWDDARVPGGSDVEIRFRNLRWEDAKGVTTDSMVAEIYCRNGAALDALQAVPETHEQDGTKHESLLQWLEERFGAASRNAAIPERLTLR